MHVCVCLCTVFPNESVKHSGIWINRYWNYLFWFLIANYYNYLVFLCYTPSWIFPKGIEVFGSLNWQLWKFLRNYLWKYKAHLLCPKVIMHIPLGSEKSTDECERMNILFLRLHQFECSMSSLLRSHSCSSAWWECCKCALYNMNTQKLLWVMNLTKDPQYAKEPPVN